MEKSADKPDTSHDSSSLSPYFLTHLVCLNHLGVELSCSKEEEEDKGECAVSPFAPSPLSYIGGSHWGSAGHLQLFPKEPTRECQVEAGGGGAY